MTIPAELGCVKFLLFLNWKQEHNLFIKKLVLIRDSGGEINHLLLHPSIKVIKKI